MYKNVVETIDHFASKYGDIELIRSITNSVNENQLSSKKWCVDHIIPYLSMHVNNKVLVAAGWYGLLGHMLKEYDVTTFDMDPMCREVGKKLYPELTHTTANMQDFDPKGYGTIICTACEHITDEVLNDFLRKRSKPSLVCLQSNNYYGIDGHINCKNSLEEFTNSLECDIIEKMALEGDKYTRFMVIGK